MTNRATLIGISLASALSLSGCDQEIIAHAGSGTDTEGGANTDTEAGFDTDTGGGFDTDTGGGFDTGTGGGFDTDTGGDPDASFPGDVATAYCTALFACGGAAACEPHHEVPYETETECVTHEQSRLEELRVNANDAGMIFDPGCVDQVLATYATLECRSIGEAIMQVPAVATDEGFGCQPYHGSIPLSDGTCIEVAGTNLGNCEAGAFCSNGSCGGYEAQAHCYEQCAPGTTCGESPWVAAELCAPIAGLGDPCYSEFTTLAYCGDGSHCSVEFGEDGLPTDGTCVPQVAVGQPCERNSECETYFCDEGICGTQEPYLCGQAPRFWRSNDN